MQVSLSMGQDGHRVTLCIASSSQRITGDGRCNVDRQDDPSIVASQIFRDWIRVDSLAVAAIQLGQEMSFRFPNRCTERRSKHGYARICQSKTTSKRT